jgi:hypothetical protein
MALKPDRYEDWVITDFYMNEVAEAGVLVVFDTGTSGLGANLDDVNAKVKLPDNAAGSGELPAGILMGNVVNLDLTRTHLNPYNRDAQVGSKVGVVRFGSSVTTNKLASGVNPTVGQAAYFTTNGELTVTALNSTRIGTWFSSKDADGYAKLQVHLA